jgi:transglutaminase-like putative cysteine protease
MAPGRIGGVEMRQEIRIVNLGGKLVPAAPDPIAASAGGELRWNADASTLIKADGDLVAGDVYAIVSVSPQFVLEDLEAATSTEPGDPIYLELPDDFPAPVNEVARVVTADAATPYEAALTLQNWFRSEFEYSLEIQAGHSVSAIEAFLRDRVGYSEQFAGTYAVMMRTLGIPARVAVGFTPGVDAGDQGFSVSGRDAHAWPEVWFDGLGWVPFEPTPGRGAPGAENFNNVDAQPSD